MWIRGRGLRVVRSEGIGWARWLRTASRKQRKSRSFSPKPEKPFTAIKAKAYLARVAEAAPLRRPAPVGRPRDPAPEQSWRDGLALPTLPNTENIPKCQMP